MRYVKGAVVDMIRFFSLDAFPDRPCPGHCRCLRADDRMEERPDQIRGEVVGGDEFIIAKEMEQVRLLPNPDMGF